MQLIILFQKVNSIKINLLNMLNIALIDPIPQKDHRISKDTSGGYGTANDFGDTLAV